jgi:hypothetical protein
MKSKLLQKSAAPQFPPIPPEEAKKWLLSQGFTEQKTDITDPAFRKMHPSMRGKAWQGSVSVFEKDQHEVVLNLNLGTWDYTNHKSHMGDDGTRPRDLISKVKNVLRVKKDPFRPDNLPQIELGRSQDVVKGDYRGYIDKKYPYPNDMDTYTIFTTFKDPDTGEDDEDMSEEIDVVAKNEKHARAIANAAIKEDYMPGVTIGEVVWHPRGVMFM